MNLEERIEKIERSNGRLHIQRQMMIVCVIVIGMFFFLINSEYTDNLNVC